MLILGRKIEVLTHPWTFQAEVLFQLELFDCCAVDGDASAQASLIVDCLKWDSSGCICINLDYYFLFEIFLIIIFYLFFPPCIDITGKYHGIFFKINIIKDPGHRHNCIVIFHSYHIISLLDIPSWSYGSKIGNWHIWPNFCDLWPYNLTFDLYYFTKNAYLLQSFLTWYWTFQTESMAEKSYFWPKFNDLWPWANSPKN